MLNAEEKQITNGEGSKKHGWFLQLHFSRFSGFNLIIIAQNQSFLISGKIHLKVTILKPSYSFEPTPRLALAATDGIYGLDSHWLLLQNHWFWLAVVDSGAIRASTAHGAWCYWRHLRPWLLLALFAEPLILISRCWFWRHSSQHRAWRLALGATDGIYAHDSYWPFYPNRWSWLGDIFLAFINLDSYWLSVRCWFWLAVFVFNTERVGCSVARLPSSDVLRFGEWPQRGYSQNI